MSSSQTPFQPGQVVAVTQQIIAREHTWGQRVEGQVVRFERKKTGSWFAHAKDDKLWLDRLVLEKEDGEIVVINLDASTHVDILSSPSSTVVSAEAVDDLNSEDSSEIDPSV